jgi:hypothetical protein
MPSATPRTIPWRRPLASECPIHVPAMLVTTARGIIAHAASAGGVPLLGGWGSGSGGSSDSNAVLPARKA